MRARFPEFSLYSGVPAPGCVPGVKTRFFGAKHRNKSGILPYTIVLIAVVIFKYPLYAGTFIVFPILSMRPSLLILTGSISILSKTLSQSNQCHGQYTLM